MPRRGNEAALGQNLHRHPHPGVRAALAYAAVSSYFNNSLKNAQGMIAGFSKSQLLYTNFRKYTSRPTARILLRIFNRIYRTGIPLANQDFNAVKKGKTVVLEISAALARDRDGRPIGFRGMLRDITMRRRAEAELKELEKQLYHAQRMEAIGTLAGGIAHDFNNSLQSMLGYTQILIFEKKE